jgi:N-methylhydantoinase A
MTVERGVDPRELALLPFGGAGPLHAVAMAEDLGMTTVLCPRASGVLAALGLVVSERRRDVQRSVMLAGDALTRDAVESAVDELAGRARSELGGAGELRTVFDLRYRGQAFELPVSGELREPDELREAFAAAHEQAYGYRDPEGAIELVTIRVTAALPGPEVDPDAAGAGGELERGSRRAVFAGQARETAVLRGEPAPGEPVQGPVIVELPESTLVVPPGWAGEVVAGGTIRLERG